MKMKLKMLTKLRGDQEGNVVEVELFSYEIHMPGPFQ
jgi:hypothetical protein